MKTLVTGWRSGIGAEVARQLAEGGHEVVRFRGDVSNALDWFGHEPYDIEGLVNCAGIVSEDTATEETLEHFNHVLAVNLVGPWLGMKHVLPAMMKRKRGSIVNVTSIYAADSGNGRAAAYHASKAGLSMLTRNAARMYGKFGIRINEVRPGFTDTKMAAAFHGSEAYRKYVLSRTTAGRLANPGEVAEVIVFVLGLGGSFMNGASVAVDGGWNA